MSIEVCVLASGSSGNCTVLRTPGGTMLIDCGIGPRAAARRMNGTGVHLGEVSAICLTHLDSDHFSPNWTQTICKQEMRLFCHRDCVSELIDIAGEELEQWICGFENGFQPLPSLNVQAIVLAHDDKPCHGYVLEGFGCRIGYATDLGRVPRDLFEHFCDLDILALESNYDPRMQLDSSRPWFLKQRIMSGRGHLSNDQAFDAVCRILDQHEARRSPLPSHVVLLHRSRQCNCPKLMRKLFLRDKRLEYRLTLAEQFERSAWLRVRNERPLVGEQLELSWH